ncbi:MAG: hypothetical protein II262_05465 [Alistipes sp.]|nr:hypothetical protein [Alistipes sp.]
MRRLLLLLFAVLFFSSHKAMAWGGWAHKLIATIAETHLTPEAGESANNLRKLQKK